MAYGDDRQVVASDTFDSSIDGNWDNGPGDWGTYVWASGGFVNLFDEDESCAMSYTGASFADNQWAKSTAQSQDSGSYLSAHARHQGGAAEAMYSATAAAAEDEYQIYEFTEGLGGGSPVASVGHGGELPFSAGEYIVIEVEGTTIRLGSNAGGSDAQKVTHTDNTLTSGDPGVGGYEGSSAAATDVTAFEAGDIAAGGSWDASGSPTLEKITSAGAAEIEKIASGAVQLSGLTSAGAAVIEKIAGGSPVLSKLTSAGAAVVEKIASGAPVLSKITSAGVAVRTGVKITSVSGDDTWADGDSSIPIVGTGFV